MSTKEITLKYHDYEIPITISKDFEQCKEQIIKKLYLKDLNSDKWSLFYYDEDEYENDIDEDVMDEAFEAKVWGLENKDENENHDQDKKVNSEEIMKSIKKKVNSEQKLVDEKIKNIKEELTKKFTNALKEQALKYEKIIEQLKETNKSLKEKNKKNIEEITKLHESSIQGILKNVQEYSQVKLGNELENYNQIFNTELSSAIKQNKDLIEKQNSNVKNMLNSMNQYKENLHNTLENSKNNFSKIYQRSMQNINLNK